MTFVIVIIAVVLVSLLIAKYYPKKSTSTIVDTPVETISLEAELTSIHEEVAKTVAEIKAQKPIEEPKKPAAKKPATKKPAAKKPAAKMSAKKKNA